jgi:mannitol-1-phosphate 5-dehydrogenase
LHEKLYGFNTAHALAAYLGWLRGHRTVDAAIADPFVRSLVAGAALEARCAVLRAHPELVPDGSVDVHRDLRGPVAQLFARFADPELADPVTRVGRDPLRKLGPQERLIGPVRLLRRGGASPDRPPAHFALGVAAALLFGFADDELTAREPQVRMLRAMLRRHGVVRVLELVAGLSPVDPFTTAVEDRYHRFVFLDDGVRFPPANARDPIGALP